MRERIERLVLGGLLGALIFYAFITFLRRGFATEALAYVAATVGAAMILVVIRSTPVWPGLLLGSLLLTYSPPVGVLHRIELGMVLVMFIGLVYIVRSALAHPPASRVFAAAEAWFMLMALTIVLARFAKDRPGSALLGEVGGAGEASLYLLGALTYFLAALVFAEDWDADRNTAVVLKIGLLATLAQISLAAYRTQALVLFIGGIFSRQLWLLLPLLMAWFSERKSTVGGRSSRMSAFLAWFTILLGISTPFRSRPFFAVGIVLGVAARYRRLRRVAAVLVVGGLVALAVLVAAGTERLSPLTARSLSTIVRADETRVFRLAHQFGTSSEMGWTSEFRREMWRLASHHIRSHPWFGKGFILSRAELGFALTGFYDFQRATLSISLAGGYHNSVLALAVFAGIPCAAAFVCAMLLGSWRFYRMARRTPLTESRVMQAAVLGFFIPCAGQMLMNGMGNHFYVVCVLLGTMRGMCVREARLRLRAGEATAAEEGPQAPVSPA